MTDQQPLAREEISEPIDGPERKSAKEERKAYVQAQRKAFKENPKEFLLDNVIKPTMTYWKTRPLHALFTFAFWATIYFLAFGAIQAVNNDMIYCDSSLDQYDGKVMFTFNDFVAEYNQKARLLQEDSSLPTLQREKIINTFYEDYTIFCNYNLTRWNSEPVLYRLNTTYAGFKKIITKT